MWTNFLFIMENNQNNLVPYNARELIKKCKTKQDIINICREIGKNNEIIF